jgi:fumarate reductase flavoprotein subunit
MAFQMAVRLSTACVIVGGGFAGMVAARRLQQLGVSAVVLEKGDLDGGLGNTVISGGLIHVAWEPPDSTYEDKHERLLAETGGEIDLELADALAAESAHIIPWLQAEGVAMRQKTDERATRWTLYPFRTGSGRRLLPDMGPARAMTRLYDAFRAADGDVRMGSQAFSLGPMPGGWRVRYSGAWGEAAITAPYVLFADGGFQANAEMLSRYVGPNAGLCLLRASTSGSGDGLRMLLENGAGTAGLGRVYGHIVSLDALHSDDLWPFPHLDGLCMAGLMIDRHGHRFAAGTNSPAGLVTRLARTDDPRGYIVVFDHELWTGPAGLGDLGLPAPNPEIQRRGGHLAVADTVASLADLLGLRTERLAASIAEHNDAVGSRPIARSPFYGARLVPGITFTMGGAMIGRDAGVRRPDGRSISGLYAAGSTAGGIQGGPNGGYVGGLAAAATFGYIAAESIAARVHARLW